jgi:outer membrane immunogenic protein
MKKFAVAAAAVVAMSLPAVAADMPTKGPAAPVVPTPYNWTGFYAGVSVGWGWTSQDVTFPFPSGNQITSASIDTDGAVFGGHIGYQYQIGRWVIGAEASLSAFIDRHREEATCAFPLPFQDRCDAWGPKNIWTAGGRLGYAVADPWLIYVSGGYAETEVKTGIRFGSTTAPPLPNAAPLALDDTHHSGWYVGGGVEYGLTRTVWLGLDYQHFDFGSTRQCGNAPGGTPCSTPAFTRDIDTTTDIGA